MRRQLAVSIGLVVILTSCSAERPSELDPTDTTAPSTTTQPPAKAQEFPDVIAATATQRGDDGTFDFAVTISSPYDSPDRYADAWRIVGSNGEVLGVRELLHDHSSEQPFTRSLTGVEIPPGVETVTIEGRDLVNGWGGATVELALTDS